MSATTDQVTRIRPVCPRGVGPGELVALCGANNAAWVKTYLGLVDAGASVLVLDSSAPPAEQERILASAGAHRRVDLTPEGQLTVTPLAPAPSSAPDDDSVHVVLPTSGTTGAPKLVRRTLASFHREGLRLAAWCDLSADDCLTVPIPMWHAYALGWVHAAHATGCGLLPVPPGALGRCAEAVAGPATVMPLVPSVARLLAARTGHAVRDNRLRLVMVGAGPVDAGLERRFEAGFGIGLARNYGSTETGALFSAPPGSPDGCVGHPMRGVRFRIDAPDTAWAPTDAEVIGAEGELVVDVDGAGWHEMGDLVRWDDLTGLTPVGRRTLAVRRGDRWVSPEELETVLRGHPEVVEARVYGEPTDRGVTALRADVVHVRGPAGGDEEDVRAVARAGLAPHKVPDTIRLVGDVPRTASAKPLRPRPLTLGDPAVLVAAAQAYKRSELLFALAQLGVLDRLARRPATAAQVAADLGLDREACQDVLRVAEDLGLLRPGPQTPTAAGEFIALEAELSRSWCAREELVGFLRSGPADRAFDRQGPSARLKEVYQAAMHNPGAHRRSAAGLALARPPRGGTLLEITSGPARYSVAVPDGTAVTLGRMAGAARPTVPAGTFDVVVVCNAVHLDGLGSDLPALAGLLAPGGRLLVDDVFTDTPGGIPAETRLDWLTHGATAWPTHALLAEGLARTGLSVVRTVHVGTPAATLLVAAPASAADPR